MSDKEKYRKLKQEDFFDYSEDRLSEEVRHAFERRTQQDPFDADAAEGFEKVGREEAEKDLSEVTRYIQRRIGRRRRIAIYSAAAAVASLLIISTIFFNVDTGNRSAERIKEMSEAGEKMTVQTDPASTPETGSEEIEERPAATSDQTRQEGVHAIVPGKESRASQQGSGKERPTIADEVSPQPEAAEKEALQAKGEPMDHDFGELPAVDEAAREEIEEALPQALLEAKSPGIKADDENGIKKEAATTASETGRRKFFNRTAMKETPAANDTDDAAGIKGMQTAPGRYVISGVVVSTEDSMPLPGASIIVKGTTLGTVSGFDGEFELPVSGVDELTLQAQFVGMEKSEVSVRPGQPVSITMDPSYESLDEVVVVGSGVMKRQDLTGSVSRVDMDRAHTSTYREAMPVNGTDAFKEYVEQSLVFPDTTWSRDRAVVVLRFNVTPNGRPADIQPVRSPGPAFTLEATRVLEDGPDWTRATMDGAPVDVEVRLRIAFKKED